MGALETIVDSLETERLPLEEMVSAYERGVKPAAHLPRAHRDRAAAGGTHHGRSRGQGTGHAGRIHADGRAGDSRGRSGEEDETQIPVPARGQAWRRHPALLTGGSPAKFSPRHIPFMPELPEIKSPADLKALPGGTACRPGGKDPADAHHHAQPDRRPPRAEPRRGRTDHRPAPGLRHAEGQVRLRRRHQGYVHKMLTGRWDRIHTIRQYEGLNGFLPAHRERARLLRRGPRRHRARRRARHGRRPRPARQRRARRLRRRRRRLHLRRQRSRRSTTSPRRPSGSSSCSTTTSGASTATSAPSRSYFNAIATNPTYAHLHEKAADFVEKIARQGHARASPARSRKARRACCCLAHRGQTSACSSRSSASATTAPSTATTSRCSSRPSSFSRRRTSRSSSTSSPRRAAATNPRSTIPASSTASANTTSRPARPRPRPRRPIPRSSRAASPTSPRRTTKIVAITGAMPGGTGLVRLQEGDSRALLRRRHRRGARRALRLRPGDAGT